MSPLKPFLLFVLILFAFSVLRAQAPGWQPSPGYAQLPIWPGTQHFQALFKAVGLEYFAALPIVDRVVRVEMCG